MSDLQEVPVLLFFIYDLEISKQDLNRDTDPLLKSILYFHPNSGYNNSTLSQSNLERRTCVVGQIIGTSLCTKQILLSSPKLISLERGKFALSWSGRFILVVGSSTPVPTHIIQNQRDFIHRLLGGKFGELSTFFANSELSDTTENCLPSENSTDRQTAYEKCKTEIEVFLDLQLNSISKKWIELTSQPILQ